MKKRKILSILLILNLWVSICSPNMAMSVEAAVPDQETSTTEMSVDVSVPEVINITGTPGNLTADSYTVTNNDSRKVSLDSLTVEGKNDWEIVPTNTDFTHMGVDQKKLGLAFNDEDICEGLTEIGELESEESITFDIDAMMGVTSDDINEDLANIILTITSESNENDCLCFTAEEADSTIQLTASGSPDPIELVYSTDENNWKDYIVGDTITLAGIGDKIYLKAKSENSSLGKNPKADTSWGILMPSADHHQFVMSGKIKATGNIQYLLDCTGKRNDVPSACYYDLFKGCSSLTELPDLSGIELGEWCYSGMFSDCSSITTPPELPATILNSYCYFYMFARCSGLTKSSDLSSIEIADNCYNGMYLKCTGLTQAPELPATKLEIHCYDSMFKGCTGLTQAPELPATSLKDYCYACMFSGCTSLKQAPNLLASTLARSCYEYMFEECTNLIQAPELTATTLSSYCYNKMFTGCTKIKLSTTQTGEYKTPYRIPKEGTGIDVTDALTDMFKNTGGTFKGTPSINKTYYGAW